MESNIHQNAKQQTNQVNKDGEDLAFLQDISSEPSLLIFTVLYLYSGEYTIPKMYKYSLMASQLTKKILVECFRFCCKV
ncbi:hypothetical protein CN553_12790 [Bacillus cereus]|uniref:Uncharacterized protein n=1 Tax=Bacillus cereus TaxID=1396 RepID=A0A9X6UC07_BACCE|nr:hypothetical protein CN553_12790 [Bacillus cereus]